MLRQSLYLYPHILTAFVIASVAVAGPWPFVMVAWLYIASIGIDRIFGNRFETRIETRGRDSFFFDLTVYGALPMHLAVLAVGLWQIGYNPLAWWEVLGITLVMGASGGALGIVAAHELIHRRRGWERALGVALLVPAHIPHFRIEHVYNHHRKVATPEDPASAAIGDNVWSFIGRSMVGQYISAWKTERERLIRRGKPAFGVRNRMLQYFAMQIACAVVAGLLFGWLGLAAYLLQGFLAAGALEVINFIEHYGLRRKEIAPGRYEPVQHHHSWSTSEFTTEYGLFGLGRHAAHHVDGSIPYPELFNEKGMPQLPAGYAGCYMMALIPPLWRRVMDPRARAVQAQHAGNPAPTEPSLAAA